jgi:N-acetylglucosamine-6-phosphate deacetylase
VAPTPDLTVRAAAALLPDGLAGPVEVAVREGVVVAVRPGPDPADGSLLVPGFVDLQVNGVGDLDAGRADGGDWAVLGERLAATGVTAWLPTVVTRPLDRYAGPLGRIARARVAGHHGAVVLGAHLEGPFLGGRPGAHDPSSIVPLHLDWLGALPDVVRLVTLAPEQPDAVAAITALAERQVLVALGHSDADHATATAAIDAGAVMVTHLFNAMGPLHQREPGLAGAALADDRVVAGLIADLVHVHPSLLRTAFRAKGAHRIVLVTDAVAWQAGHLAGAAVRLVDGVPRLPDGTIAGSALTMDAAVRNVVDAAGVPLADALVAASATPAAVLGDATRGRIEVGRRADLVLLGRDDLQVRCTLVGGVTAWEA